MFAQILLFILDTVCGFLTLALLMRFAMQWARTPFRNPLGQFIVAVTDWMVRPVRRLVPGLFGLDLTSLLLAWLWQVAYQGIALGLSGLLSAVSPAPILVVAMLAALDVAKIGLTRPLLRPFRRVIPPIGGVDLSPLALLLVLQIALFVIAGLRQNVMPMMLLS